jgi:peptidyl-prolyl cis-trans isomerase C
MEKRLQEFERAEMARRVASTRIAATVNVTNEDVSQYIDVNAERLKTEFHLEMVRFTREAEAKESLSMIQSGVTFESVAREKFPRHQNSGEAAWDLGYLQWNQIPFEWREAVEKLGEKEVRGVLQGKQTGFCIVKLVDRRMNPKADLSSMRAGIMNWLRDEKIAQAYEAYINSLRNDAKIILQKERRTSFE